MGQDRRGQLGETESARVWIEEVRLKWLDINKHSYYKESNEITTREHVHNFKTARARLPAVQQRWDSLRCVSDSSVENPIVLCLWNQEIARCAHWSRVKLPLLQQQQLIDRLSLQLTTQQPNRYRLKSDYEISLPKKLCCPIVKLSTFHFSH